MEPFQGNSMSVDSDSEPKIQGLPMKTLPNEPWQNSDSDSLLRISDSNNCLEETDPLYLNSEVDVKQEIIDTEDVDFHSYVDVATEDKILTDVKKMKHVDLNSEVEPFEVKQEIIDYENMDFQSSHADDDSAKEDEILLNVKKLKQEMDPLDLNPGPAVDVKQEIIYSENINFQSYVDASKDDKILWNLSNEVINNPIQEDDGFMCLVCDVELFHLKEVINHVLTLHCSKGYFQCTLCNTQLDTRGMVKKHIKNVHFGIKPFTCPLCKKSIQQKSHLKTHILKQHPGKKSLLKKAVTNHKKVEAQMTNNKIVKSSIIVNDDSLTCPICHKVYLSIETKEKHLLTFHKQSLAKFDEIQYQHNHENKTSSTSATSFECPVCHVKLSDMEAKKTHLKSVHRYLKHFECMDCQLVVYSQLHLNVHMHVYHTMPQNLPMSVLQCEYHNCKQEFGTLEQVLNHVEIQHAYQCPECPRHVQTTSGLAKHYKKAHINNQLVCCNYCGNCYKDDYELENHIRQKHPHDSTIKSSDIMEQQHTGKTCAFKK